jgi:type III restriction enzyme
MDKGAHFRRCDFQVHTPRDINWNGDRPITEDDRREYSRRFIAACREKNLGAVAITDHHDLAFFPYIKEAAQKEHTPENDIVAECDQIIVFPGMELTLGIGCQALLILDAELPIELLPHIATALSLTCNDPSERIHAQTTRLEHFRDFEILHNRLDELSFLKGKYIILPNVNSGGDFTLQRKGLFAHYNTMRCVGGYLDHEIGKVKPGDRAILDGAVAAYSYKALGIFPTSDNRHNDFSRLGTNCAWVKWSRPTAEAIRQACLARKTRIAHVAPQLPSVIIESLHVSLSKFLGAIDISFNPQFNCLIGGRGTGKSTILEYLRWGVCDQPLAVHGDSDVPDFQAKRTSLIEHTLKPHNAIVSVVFQLNGVRHTVRRRSETGEVLLKVGDEPEKSVREQDVRELLPLHAYSQKQLSAVGVRSEELMRFIESPIARRLSELDSLKADSVARIRSAYGIVQRKGMLAQDIARQEVELGSLEKQLAELQKGLKGLSAEDQQVLTSHKQFLIEQECFRKWEKNTERLVQVVATAKMELATLPARLNLDDASPNKSLLAEAETRLGQVFSVARQKLDEIQQLLSESSDDWRQYVSCKQNWDGFFDTLTTRYKDVKERATEHEALLKQISEIELRITSLRNTIAERRSDLERHGQPEEELQIARTQWSDLFQKRAELLDERCRDMTELSGGMILAFLKRAAGYEAASKALSAILEGSGIRSLPKKIDDLCRAVSESVDCVAKWQSVLADFQSLLTASLPGASKLAVPPTPSITESGFTSQDIEKISKRINADNWLQLSLVELTDSPSFRYRLREGEYVAFSDASAGQQATALLRVLLNQKGPPLVIDQPEDDLDNQVVLEVVEEIWKAKQNRQIIFSSHNANVVVNGDADLVVVCGYRNVGDQSGGKICCEGAIDMPDIRTEITSVMEGGKTAFLMRQEKYGF